MAAIFYGIVTCNGSAANGATLEWTGGVDATTNSQGQYTKDLDAGNYAITAAHSPCSDETKASQFYDNGFHNVDFSL